MPRIRPETDLRHGCVTVTNPWCTLCTLCSPLLFARYQDEVASAPTDTLSGDQRAKRTKSLKKVGVGAIQFSSGVNC